MKLTRRIFAVLILAALLVSVFVVLSSAEFTEDNIEDILEYYQYPDYVKEDFSSYEEDSEYYGSPTLDSSASLDFETDYAKVVIDPSNKNNKVLSYRFVAQDSFPGYFGYTLDINEKISEMVLSVRVRANKSGALSAPSFSINLGAYNSDGNPVGEDSLVTPLLLDFETGKVSCARVSASDSSVFVNTPVSDYRVNSGVWYTVELTVNCKAGNYSFSITQDGSEKYESESYNLGDCALFDEVSANFKNLPATSGTTSFIDDIKISRGTFARGDKTRDVATAEALDNLKTFTEENELDIETQLRVVKVYETIIASDYVPVFTEDYKTEQVQEFYDYAVAYVPEAYSRAFCAEANSIDSGKSYYKREAKLALVMQYVDVMNDKDYYLSLIDNAVSALEAELYVPVNAELLRINTELQKPGISEDAKAELEASLKTVTDLKAAISNTISVYKISISKGEAAETRVDVFSSAIEEIIDGSELLSDVTLEDDSDLYDLLYDTTDVLELNEELYVKILSGWAKYDAEVKDLEAVKTDSEAFVAAMQNGYDAASRDYTYIIDTYLFVSKFTRRDPSYNYPDGVYNYMEAYNALEVKYNGITENVNKFKAAVALMQKEGASFDEIYNQGYVVAKSVYNGGVIHPELDTASVPGLNADIAKYLEIEASLGVAIKASEEFIAAVEYAKSATLYQNIKTALAGVNALLAVENNSINDAYPGVSNAKAEIAAIEKRITDLEAAAAAYIAAVADIDTKENFNDKKTAISKALALRDAGNVVGYVGVDVANLSLENHSAAIAILEGNTKTFLESVEKLGNDALTLSERRALIIIAEKAKLAAEPTYDGVASAINALEAAKASYKESVAAINSAFGTAVSSNVTTAGASVNQPRYNSVIELVKLIIANIKNS